MFPELMEMIVNSNFEDLEKSCVTLRSTVLDPKVTKSSYVK